MKSDKRTTNDYRLFPENKNDLYIRMCGYMPHCYFPTALNEDAIHKLAGEEFCRIRGIVCRECHFDEDKHIAENAGSSPFDAVRDDIGQEVYRRIRKDDMQLSIISARESLMEKIRLAVEKENNIVGTFYRNRGVHYRKDESPEYDTSPIVVIHNSKYYGYGGYESATVYELFINENGKLLCTLNGEAGEDFDEPIGHVQTEGLIEIAHWLEEYGFIAGDASENEIIVCANCGSSDIQTQAWVDPNAHLFIATTGIDRDDNWCNECNGNFTFCTQKAFKQQMQEWWGSLDFKEMERISGFRQDVFSPEDGYQDFVDACNNWWRRQGYKGQRSIWTTYHEMYGY